MRLLFVTHYFPYPPTSGGRIGCLNPIKYLSRRHEIILVTMGDVTDARYVETMKQYCVAIHLFVRRVNEPLRLAKGLISTPPGSAAKYHEPRFGRLIQDCVDRYQVDLVELQHLNTAAYLRYASAAPVLLREHNVEYKIWERQAAHAPSLAERTYMRLCAARVRQYEADMACRFVRCITVSRADADALRAISPHAHIEVIPSGVDTEYFAPDRSPERPYSMVLTGSFDWHPKQHNLGVVLIEIFPRIRERLPQATLSVVGTGIPEHLMQLGKGIAGVEMIGPVPDVRLHIRQASLVLQYMETGGGIALKVLEAMAMRKPVLSNTLGCEGVQVEHGRDAFLADGASAYADAAIALLQDSATREKIATGGYTTVQNAYSWHHLARAFEQCYCAVLAERYRQPQRAGTFIV
jgi:glycosyltransferase involved in cell wall biosynthesis